LASPGDARRELHVLFAYIARYGKLLEFGPQA
jgi:hypothetical protein